MTWVPLAAFEISGSEYNQWLRHAGISLPDYVHDRENWFGLSVNLMWLRLKKAASLPVSATDLGVWACLSTFTFQHFFPLHFFLAFLSLSI